MLMLTVVSYVSVKIYYKPKKNVSELMKEKCCPEICKKYSLLWSQNSSVSLLMDNGLDDQVSIRSRGKISLFYTVSRLALELTKPARGSFPDVKQQGMKLTTHHQLGPRSRMVELCLHSPMHLHGMILN
jgi:hypothetical protein